MDAGDHQIMDMLEVLETLIIQAKTALWVLGGILILLNGLLVIIVLLSERNAENHYHIKIDGGSAPGELVEFRRALRKIEGAE